MRHILNWKLLALRRNFKQQKELEGSIKKGRHLPVAAHFGKCRPMPSLEFEDSCFLYEVPTWATTEEEKPS